ncbi:aminopeptidase P family protein [Sphingomicrobium astaxanthinifaciens]|uniref:aminopeptidase P family protein n=1 Tax=Sphingomicrobium astaxanthinifaciens TaxID=1227949 RepID=UPI001FCC2AA3|nr:aminopeptidase P family protein [Sphingomicrobium astaxanthinifaciens]MCJ7421424.1 aminopeptidase P family protein [Sphingomicrobium astaxanthinifaciens]
MSTHADRLAALRTQLKDDALDGFVVPLTDEHMSEYVGSYAQRLAWLTGFDGSAGAAAVLPEEAAIFTDGRYTIQVRNQVDGELFSYEDVPQTSIAQWLATHAPEGGRIGYDPWLHTRAWVKAATKALADKGAQLVAVERNPIDQVWIDRPARSSARLEPYSQNLAGRSSASKREDIARWLEAEGATATVIAALDSIAWTLNVRGCDIVHTPVALAFLIVHDDASADLFIDTEKADDALRNHLGEAVRIHPRADFEAHLEKGYAGKTVAVDPERSVAAIEMALERGGARVLARRDPAVLPKAIKNEAEIAGHRAAQERDGAVIAKFLKWLDEEAPKGGQDELSVAAKLYELREATGELRDLSFDTISGAGANGALPHYRVDEASSAKLEMNSIYLVDSGGQYLDGTTDITRTVIIGTPTAEMIDRYTRVLKGHIAIARARFPEGISGGRLDSFARQYLWEIGEDYAHGTGHGVGAFLAVHEGPQRISPPGGAYAGADEPLREGMILSNEPGFYKEGAYGMRIENLVLVVAHEVEGRRVLGFETLTFAPLDRRLIDKGMLTPEEIAWVDEYHAEVAAKIGPQLEGDERAWLEAQCAPL